MPLHFDENEQTTLNGKTVKAMAVQEYLVRKGATRPCSACGSNDWWVSVSPGNGQYTAMDSTGNDKPNREAPVAFVTCINCTYMRMHSLGMLAHVIVPEQGQDE